MSAIEDCEYLEDQPQNFLMSFVFLTTSNVIDMNPPTVLILTAGIGSRLQPLTNKLNKTLVSIDDNPVIVYNRYYPAICFCYRSWL